MEHSGNLIWLANAEQFSELPGIATPEAVDEEIKLQSGKEYPFPRLVIADPSLVDKKGHHFELSKSIAAGAKELGISCICASHVDYNGELEVEDAQIKPIFNLDMYAFYKSDQKKIFDPKVDGEDSFIRPLEDLIKSEKLGPDDHILFHTCDAFFFETFAHLDADRAVNWPSLHLCTPYDLDSMPNRHFIADLKETLWRLGGTNLARQKLFFYGETRRLSSYMRRNLGLPAFSLELPTPLAMNAVKKKSTKNRDEIRIVYMGAAREEKGFVQIPELIRQTAARVNPNTRKRLKFVIQASPQKIGYLPVIKNAIAELEKLPKSLVTLRRKHQSAKGYYETLANADIVLLIYDKDLYRVRGSAIAVEAVSAGRIVLATTNTFPSSFITQRGGASARTLEGHIDNLVKIVENIDIHRQSAEINGREFRKRSRASTYVAKIIAKYKLSKQFKDQSEGLCDVLQNISQSWPRLVTDINQQGDGRKT